MRRGPITPDHAKLLGPETAPGAWRTVILLTLLYWVGTLDRQIAALLVPMIKADLSLTDVQISVIQGFGFGLFFMLASPLMGWLVDRYSRRGILFGGVTTWSLAAIGSGLSHSFGQLFASRAAVGACEASINPTAYAMLGRLFPAKKLSLPMSIFVLGGNLGSGMSFLLGGLVIAWVASSPPIALPLVGHLSGWQLAFVITALPGLIFAPLIWTAADERTPAQKGEAPTTFADLWRHIKRHPRFFAAHNLGFAMIMAFIVGLQSWNSAFLSRQHGWPLASIGLWMGGFQVVFAVAGLGFHGWMVDRLFGRGQQDAHLRYFTLMCLLALPCGTAAYLVKDGATMIVLYNVAYFFLMSFASVGPAALQIATPPALRGKASAVYMVVISIVGTILGPVIVAALTDKVFADETRLGLSMAIFAAATSGGAALLFMLGRAPMRRAVEEVLPFAALG